MAGRGDGWILVLFAVIIIVGGAISLYSVHTKDSQLREQILTETRLAAAGVDWKNLHLFSGSEKDLTNPAYISMKDTLTQLKAAEPLSRFVYIMGQRDDGSIFFYIDSEEPGTSGYSPPGQEYPEAPVTTLAAFATGDAGTLGPVTDRWGTWVSGLLPLRDEKTGEIIGVFGIDIDAGNWYFHVVSAAIPALIGTLLILVIIFSFVSINKRKDEENRKLAVSEKALRESEARLHAIIQGSPALQFVIDRDHRVISWNRALEKYSGIAAHDVIGTSNHWMAFFEDERPLIADILVDRDLDLLHVWYRDTIHQSDLIEGAYETTSFYPKMGKDGMWLYVLAAPYRDLNGDITGALETVVDVTERHLAEDAVKEAVKKLNLLSSITRHDILNKITMLHGLMMLISESKGDDPTVNEYIQMGVKAISAIQRQIEFTRTYQDIGIEKPEWNMVSELVQKAVNELYIRSVSLSVSLDGVEVYADPLIRKVFYNLMENSIRHGERVQHISYTYHVSGENLVIQYTDDGFGILPTDKEYIFEKGYGKNSGLGMFLAKEILSITHITIEENGVYGKGASFDITVPKGIFRLSQDTKG